MNMRKGLVGLTLGVALSFVSPQAGAAASDEFTYAKKCRKALTIKGRTYAEQRRKLLIGCADKLLRCELELEGDGIDPAACRGRAFDFCKRKLGSAADATINAARARYEAKTTAACDAVGIADMLAAGSGGLGFVADAECGAAATIAGLVACLGDRLEAEADADVGRAYPRAGLLFDNAGIGAEYPNLPRPPVVDLVVAGTAPGSCILSDPGVVALGAGEALRISGDEATLSVGGGKNGRLSVRLSLDPNDPCNDPAALQGQLREPYGSGESITFGPLPVDRSFCFALKDSACDAQLTGTVDVP